MNSLLTYIEEPQVTITRDSIMNYQLGCEVTYNDRKGIVVRISGGSIRVEFENGLYDTIHYTKMKITKYVDLKAEMSFRHWTQRQHKYLEDNLHLPNSVLAKDLCRTEHSISVRKWKIRSESKKKQLR